MFGVLEICCYSASSAMIAQENGANRIELCDNPGEGGTTPSYGVLKWVREHISIPVFPIIRPRGGHFVYNNEEIDTIETDILLCKSLGYEGVVIGLLNPGGEVAYDSTSRLVELAWPMEVTFHRAFDRARHPLEALEQIIKAGCNRVLTSGQRPNAIAGSDLIRKLVEKADNRIIIMPGSGVRSSNVADLANKTGAIEFHSSASIQRVEPYFIPDSMQEKLTQVQVDGAEVKRLVNSLREYFSDQVH